MDGLGNRPGRSGTLQSEAVHQLSGTLQSETVHQLSGGGIEGLDGQPLPVDADLLVVATLQPIHIVTAIRMDVVPFGRTMADQIGGSGTVRRGQLTGEGMLMTLQHQLHVVATDDGIEHPSLDEVVARPLQRMEGVMQHDHLPRGIAG